MYGQWLGGGVLIRRSPEPLPLRVTQNIGGGGFLSGNPALFQFSRQKLSTAELTGESLPTVLRMAIAYCRVGSKLFVQRGL